MMKFASPQVGEDIRVTVENIRPAGEIFYHLPKTHTYEGQVVPNAKQDGSNVFSMTTNLPTWRKFPVRTIALSRVVDLQYLDGSNVTMVDAETPVVRTVEVPGSKGNSYTVVLDGDRATCDCKGFQFRQQCRHINEARTMLEDG